MAIYIVTDNESRTETIVSAPSKAAAIRHVVAPRFSAVVASAADAVSRMAQGAKYEVAGAEASHDTDS